MQTFLNAGASSLGEAPTTQMADAADFCLQSLSTFLTVAVAGRPFVDQDRTCLLWREGEEEKGSPPLSVPQGQDVVNTLPQTEVGFFLIFFLFFLNN